MSVPQTLRVRPDFTYTPQEWVDISVAPGFGGFALLMPGRTEADQSVLKLVAHVRGGDGAESIRYKPAGDGLQIIDIAVEPTDLRAEITALLESNPDKGLDPKPPVIR